ncbi:MAG: nucleotide exchange factor GrpE [Cryomorphaceae bacterium]|nr:nucleotide exchange factor GrpE [Cryomorphaceae bacterium]
MAKEKQPAEEPKAQNEMVTGEMPQQENPTVEGEPTTGSELDNLQEEFQALKEQNLRLYAEFENFRRRNARERLDLMATANEKVLKALLPVVDDFERALKNIPADSAVRIGMELIYTKLINTLKTEGLKEMESPVGQVFDVETMEAITNIPAPSPELGGKVIDQIEKGYTLGEKIIRYTRVVVADQHPG